MLHLQQVQVAVRVPHRADARPAGVPGTRGASCVTQDPLDDQQGMRGQFGVRRHVGDQDARPHDQGRAAVLPGPRVDEQLRLVLGAFVGVLETPGIVQLVLVRHSFAPCSGHECGAHVVEHGATAAGGGQLQQVPGPLDVDPAQFGEVPLQVDAARAVPDRTDAVGELLERPRGESQPGLCEVGLHHSQPAGEIGDERLCGACQFEEPDDAAQSVPRSRVGQDRERPVRVEQATQQAQSEKSGGTGEGDVHDHDSKASKGTDPRPGAEGRSPSLR